MRILAVAVCALAMAACTSSVPVPATSPGLLQGTDSPAADLRTQTDMLLEEHVHVIAKLSAAAVAGRKDEYHSYTLLLAQNGGDLETLMRSALGETEGAQFGQMWSRGNSAWIDYIVSSATHDDAGIAGAAAALTVTFLQALAQVIATNTSSPLDATTKVADELVAGQRHVIDDAVAGNIGHYYTDLRSAANTAMATGDDLSEGIVARFPDRFAGAVAGKGATTRALLDSLLQQHAYLTTMATDALIAGAAADQGAATTALALNASDLAAEFAKTFGPTAGSGLAPLLTGRDTDLIAYARAATDADRQSALSALTGSASTGLAAFLHDRINVDANILGQVQATVLVIDDQRTQSFAGLAHDDSSAARLLVSIGDAIAAAAPA